MSARAERSAVVVGSGPNGLVAALVLARRGWSVTVVEAADTLGGGTRSEALTLPGFVHDVCSAVHPLGVASPALRGLPLADHGLEWVHPDAPLAHPLDGGRVAMLERSVTATARNLGDDGYRRLLEPFVGSLGLVDDLLSPLSIPPRHPLLLARFASVGLRSAQAVARSRLDSEAGRALLAGCAGHSMLSLDRPITSAFGVLLAALGHVAGWPFARGGSRAISDALTTELEARDAHLETGHRVTSLDELPPATAVLLDLSPSQVVAVAGDRLPPRYRRRLEAFRHGPGVFKVDWALDAPVPWTAEDCSRAGTVHLGGAATEVAAAEAEVMAGGHPERPFVLVAQPSRFDPGRAPEGKHTLWAYCHVPNGSTFDMTDRIEAQIERFAPGFRDLVLARHTFDSAAMQRHDANFVGGDIGGGASDLRQFFARPVVSLAPWRTPVDGLYLCSASTPPGGGVHGMCGWHAARCVLRDAR